MRTGAFCRPVGARTKFCLVDQGMNPSAPTIFLPFFLREDWIRWVILVLILYVKSYDGFLAIPGAIFGGRDFRIFVGRDGFGNKNSKHHLI